MGVTSELQFPRVTRVKADIGTRMIEEALEEETVMSR
jgi:hypothetical protein